MDVNHFPKSNTLYEILGFDFAVVSMLKIRIIDPKRFGYLCVF